MILAAGLGTRLRPLTDRVPKALVEVGGVPMLERVARRLVAAGADRIVVNVHHHADRVVGFLRHLEAEGLGADVRISRELEAPLGTGGALRAAAPLFEKDGPFLLHNVDVITDLDLVAVWRAQRDAPDGTLGTLAVQDRETSRPLLVDGEGVLGVANRETGWRREARRAAGRVREAGFLGIHAVAPEVFGLLAEDERGEFSIWDPYFRLAGAGWRLAAFDADDAFWLDVGTPERLERARRLVTRGPPGSAETRRDS